MNSRRFECLIEKKLPKIINAMRLVNNVSHDFNKRPCLKLFIKDKIQKNDMLETIDT